LPVPSGGMGVGRGLSSLTWPLLDRFVHQCFVQQVGEDGAAGEGETFLGQVADAGALHGDDGAGVERLHASHDFREGGFAGAVRADDAGAFVGGDEPVEVFEECFGASKRLAALVSWIMGGECKEQL